MRTSRELRRIAVIGAGAAGRDLALRCVASGFDVILEDVMPSRLRNAQQTIASQTHSGALQIASTVEDAVRDADLVIDFVPDELESKLEIFSMLDRMAPPRTLLVTPMTAMSIADLAACTYRPQLCFALHFESADSTILIRTSQSSSDAVHSASAWLNTMGFNVTVRNDPAEAEKQSGQRRDLH